MWKRSASFSRVSRPWIPLAFLNKVLSAVIIEGWALYAERLGKEIGFYQDVYSDYGRLENEMWRAIRLGRRHRSA